MAADSNSGLAMRPMPKAPQQRALLARRAAELAADVEVAHPGESDEEYLRVRVGEHEHYGILYPFLDKIAYANSVTRVPCTPAFVHGVMNRRGEVLTVLALGKLVHGADAAPANEDQRVVVINGRGLTLGLLVDEVIGNEPYFPSQLAPPLPPTGTRETAYVRGIYEGRVAMLDLDAVLGDPTLRVNETSV